ncbi:acyl-coenzyme A thioesterase PaaI-like protein [Mesorhizobium sp. J18]|uniref:PaaI family thioesterase n=1 Tax=Mesorhizobium sp. J18 TaxID=935263 RepID=UPI001199E239|nr:PaaI family thioesterase [Mesorhizobium sp. J18]TWG93307.1 acyl-coenzyme A thioesterase PaaI-like protein [Mesorhizobium sp. J18]
MPEFGISEAEKTLREVFAPWIVELNLRPVSFDVGGGSFLLPENPRLVHVGGVICGQATASAADTCSVVTLAALNGRFRICTTVDLTTHFIRPLKPGDVDIRVDVLSNGKRMAYTRVEMRAKGDTRTAVSATGAFAYLED